jgi:hypothetical protein
MKVAVVILVLAGLSYLVYRYRAQIEGFLPGFKTYLWNGFVAIAGVAAPVLDYLGKVDLSTLLTKENAALAAVAIGVVGILLSMVTRRSSGEGA